MNKTLSSIIIVVTLLLITFVAGRYAYVAYPDLFGVIPEVAEVPAAQLGGSLIMTLQPSVPAGSTAAIYAVSTQGGTVKKVDDSHDYYAPSFSTDGRVAVVANVASSSWQLLVAKVSDKEALMTVVPPAPAIFPGASSWSPDNKYIVYDAVTALPAADDISIENGRVILLDVTTGMQKILDIGVSPVFMKDGSIIYIKADGIYRINAGGLASATPVDTADRVASFDEYTATRSARIALSHNEKTVLVSLLQSGGSIAYQVVRDPDFFMSEIARVAGRALFPVFSPDDQNIALISQKEDTEGHMTKSLAIEDVRTLTMHTVADLSPYTDEFLSLSAWVK